MAWVKNWLERRRGEVRTADAPVPNSGPPESDELQVKEAVSLAAGGTVPGGKPKATLFVDFEHWYYAMRNQYRMKPDTVRWRDGVAEDYEIQRIFYFANFSDPNISSELTQLRQTSNLIIESGDGSPHPKKDMTDFIMLDAIYQNVDAAGDTDTYIIFTGDGHFQSVVKYLRQRKGKKVVIYGVKASVSRALSSLADECHEIPFANDLLNQHITYILENFNNLAETKRGLYYPTFMKTVEVVSNRYDCDPEDIRATLGWLIQQGYVERYKTTVAFDNEISALRVHWDKLTADRLWQPSGVKVPGNS